MLAACLQLEVRKCSREDNLQRSLNLAAKALDGGAEILVFPELFLSGFCYSEAPEPYPYPSLDPFRDLAARHDCLIVGSTMATSPGGGMYNLGMCIDARGEKTYAKVHPFGEEREHFTSGSAIEPLHTSKGIVGLQICYDLRFPEVARRLSGLGADFLVTVAQFPSQRIDHWRTLCMARAIENQIPHLACNCCGTEGGGYSMVVDSWGRVLAGAGEEEEVISATLDLEIKYEVRNTIPCWRDRRPELYGCLDLSPRGPLPESTTKVP